MAMVNKIGNTCKKPNVKESNIKKILSDQNKFLEKAQTPSQNHVKPLHSSKKSTNQI